MLTFNFMTYPISIRVATHPPVENKLVKAKVMVGRFVRLILQTVGIVQENKNMQWDFNILTFLKVKWS